MPETEPTDSQLSALLSARGERLDSRYAYKLGGQQFGMDFALTDDVPPPDERKMCCHIVYADGSRRDGVGDLIEIGGIDLSRHRQNPIHLFDHGKHVQLPIGKVEDPETGQYTGVLDPLAKTGTDLVFFYQKEAGLPEQPGVKAYDHAVFCAQVFDLLAKKYIRAGSIGYLVKAARELYADYETGTPKGQHLLQTLKLESSTVVLPANGDTVRKMLAMPRVADMPLSAYLVKALTPYAPAKKAVVVGGFESKAQDAGPPYRIDVTSTSGAMPQQWGVLDREGVMVAGPFASRLTAEQEAERRNREAGGQGTKALIAKYKARAFGATPSDEVSGPPQAGDTVIARGAILDTRWQPDGRPAGHTHVAKAGDRLRVLEVLGDGRLVVQNVSTTVQGRVALSDVRQQVTAAQRQAFRERPGASKPLPPGGKGMKGLEPGSRCVVAPTYNWNGKPYKSPGGGGPGKITYRHSTRDGTEMASVELDDGRIISNIPLSALSEGKSLAGTKSLRHKYRPVKGLVRRLKRGRPGHAYLHVAEKDLAALKAEAERKGLKLSRAGETAGLEKVRLAGDDAQIDAVAKMFGKSKALENAVKIKSWDGRSVVVEPNYMNNGWVVTRHVPGQTELFETMGGKFRTAAAAEKWAREQGYHIVKTTESKSLTGTQGTKSMPTDNEPAQEPHGARMLRQVHSDYSMLMKDYDDLMGPLEHDGVRKHFEGLLSNKAKALDDTEKLWGKHYKDLPPLEGMEDGEEKDLTEDEAEDIGDDLVEETADTEPEAKDADSIDDAAVAGAGADNEEEPDADEVVEGMQSKSLAARRKAWRRKGACPECGKEDCACGKSLNGKAKKKDLTEDEAAAVADDLATETTDTEAEPAGEKALEPHELDAVGQAAGFLGEAAAGQEWGEEQRMHSFHYHKTLEGIGGLAEVHDDLAQTPPESDIPPANAAPPAGAKAADPAAAWDQLPYEQREELLRQAAGGRNPAPYADVQWSQLPPQVQSKVTSHVRAYGGSWPEFKAAPGTEEWAAEEAAEPEHKASGKPDGVCEECGGKTAAGQKVCESCKFHAGDPDAEERAAAERQADSGNKCYRKMCKGASGFFKELSATPALEDAHREKMGHWAKELQSAAAPPDVHDDLPPEEPGSMGEKSLTLLAFETTRRVGHLARQLDKLRALVPANR